MANNNKKETAKKLFDLKLVEDVGEGGSEPSAMMKKRKVSGRVGCGLISCNFCR